MAMSTVIKKLSMATAGAAFIALGTAGGAQQAQAYDLFGSRTTFQNALDTLIVDDYENPGYGDDFNILSDTAMSSVLGETQYQSTGFSNINIVFNRTEDNKVYCAGCNGSFLLDFTKTTVGNALGVFGVGFDILDPTDYFAHVIFGDDTKQDFSLASVGQGFWGITSEKSIKAINVGLAGGGSTQNGYISIDNLTIGSTSVPEPASVMGLLAFGAIGVGSMLKRKQEQKA